jgi:hypothetical protein
MVVKVAIVLVIVLLVTLPFGFYRAYTRKLSVRWFAAIHVPVVFVFLARFVAHLPYYYIPATCTAFAIAQFAGGRIGHWWIGRRRTALSLET